jgi:hypothetical protein
LYFPKTGCAGEDKFETLLSSSSRRRAQSKRSVPPGAIDAKSTEREFHHRDTEDTKQKEDMVKLWLPDFGGLDGLFSRAADSGEVAI